ncbi:MAG: hypothetical protein ACREOO_32045 [bacterium]
MAVRSQEYNVLIHVWQEAGFPYLQNFTRHFRRRDGQMKVWQSPELPCFLCIALYLSY